MASVNSFSLPVGRRRRRLTVLGALAPMFAAVTASGCASVPGSVVTRGDPIETYRPALFSARPRSGANLTLFGTLHVGRPDFFPLPAPVSSALDQARRIAVEIDVIARWRELVDAFRPRVRLPAGVTLADLVSPKTLERTRAHFGFPQVVWSDLLTMQPWWVANFRFVTEADRSQGGIDSLGVERHVLAHAHRTSTPIIELESVDDQVQGLAGGTLDEQSAQFEHWFALVQQRGGLMHELLPAWRTGDLRALAELKSATWGDTVHLASLRRRFFTERDERMARRLAEASALADGPIFVAVGAYHLVGHDSLLVALRRRGFEIELLEG